MLNKKEQIYFENEQKSHGPLTKKIIMYFLYCSYDVPIVELLEKRDPLLTCFKVASTFRFLYYYTLLLLQ